MKRGGPGKGGGGSGPPDPPLWTRLCYMYCTTGNSKQLSSCLFKRSRILKFPYEQDDCISVIHHENYLLQSLKRDRQN